VQANSAFFHANSGFIQANASYNQANASFIVANATSSQANAAFDHANAAFASANNVAPQVQPAFNTANAAFIRANNSLDANNGGTVTGNVSINANLVSQNVASRSYIQFGDGSKQYTANSGAGTITLSATPPATGNSNGDIWIDSADGTEYTYFSDQDGAQWVEFGPQKSVVYANTFTTANVLLSFAQANAAYDRANASFNQANAAFSAANSAANSANATITSSRLGANLGINIIRVLESSNIFSTAIGGNVNIDVGNNTSYFFSSNATANVTFNLRANGNSGGTFNNLIPVANTLTVAVAMKQGSTRYRANLHIDNVLQTVFWLGNSSPSFATSQPESIDTYSFVVFKTAANTYTVLAANTNFGLAQGQPGQG
jgi:hypothetical protein